MANSKYEYVRLFEQPDTLLANTWVVVRIDGRGFSKFTTKYRFVKPNDRNGLDVMNAAAEAVMKELPDLVLAFGNSDEYSFVFHKDCALFERRASKLTTTIVSTFTSYYVYSWSKYFPDKPLTPPLPSFDGRAVCYPSDSNLRDYMSWRQVDCHINNLYNTTFWTLVQQGGMGAREAEQKLKGTVSSEKNEILFKDFGINYNNEPECFKKGTVLYRDFFPTEPVETSASPSLAAFPSPPIAQPTPRRASAHRTSRSVEMAIPYLQDHSASAKTSGPGPTFLSTTSTPSPSPSPPTMSRSAFPNPLRSNPVSPKNSSYPPGSSMPLSPPSTMTSPWGNLNSFNGKQHLPNLAPLPLSPPTLKPSTKPPLSLNAPNSITRANFSPTTPQHDFPAAYPISGYRHDTLTFDSRPTSHSASASLTTPGSSETTLPGRLKKRSPSQPQLPTYFSTNTTSSAGPPTIPLRISSIPANTKPRKLSLQNHRSLSTLKPAGYSSEKENGTSPESAGSKTSRRNSPPIRKNKALPSPPMTAEEEMRTREKVKGSSPQQEWSTYANDPTHSSPQRRTSESEHRGGQVWPDLDVSHPGIADLPAISASSGRPRTHSRLHSAPTSSSLYYPYQTPEVEALPSATPVLKFQTHPTTQPFPNPTTDNTSLPLKPSSHSKSQKPKHTQQPSTAATTTTTPPQCRPFKSKPEKLNKDKGKEVDVETGSWAADTIPTTTTTIEATKSSSHAQGGRPKGMSRTQKDKDRKKRSKAKILIEHVDIIKDEFWEKRPWILSGRTG